MPAHRSQSRVGTQRGSRQDAARTLRRLLVTRQNDHRNPCTAHEIHQLTTVAHIDDDESGGRCVRRRWSVVEKIGAGQESAGQKEGETDQGEEAHHEAVMNATRARL